MYIDSLRIIIVYSHYAVESSGLDCLFVCLFVFVFPFVTYLVSSYLVMCKTLVLYCSVLQ